MAVHVGVVNNNSRYEMDETISQWVDSLQPNQSLARFEHISPKAIKMTGLIVLIAICQFSIGCVIFFSTVQYSTICGTSLN